MKFREDLVILMIRRETRTRLGMRRFSGKIMKRMKHRLGINFFVENPMLNKNRLRRNFEDLDFPDDVSLVVEN